MICKFLLTNQSLIPLLHTDAQMHFSDFILNAYDSSVEMDPSYNHVVLQVEH